MNLSEWAMSEKKKLMQKLSQEVNTIDCCQAAIPCQPRDLEVTEAKKKQEKKMYELYDDDGNLRQNSTPDERKANYLGEQLHNAYNGKSSELYAAFHMNGTPAPKSPKEFVDMLSSGKFAFSKSYLNDDGSWRDENDHPYFYMDTIHRYVKWDDPAMRPDYDGHTAATEKLDAAQKDAERAITIGTPAEGLAALKDFESKTFH